MPAQIRVWVSFVFSHKQSLVCNESFSITTSLAHLINFCLADSLFFRNQLFLLCGLTLHCLCAIQSYVAFCIDDASSTKRRYEIGNESEFHYLGISCFFRPIFCISFCNFFLALLFPLFRKASIQPSTDMKQILDSIALWSQAKCSQLPWVPVLFCALVPLPFASCRVEGTHLWWRHCCTEASGVMLLFPGLLSLKSELQASCHSMSLSELLTAHSTRFGEQSSLLISLD